MAWRNAAVSGACGLLIGCPASTVPISDDETGTAGSSSTGVDPSSDGSESSTGVAETGVVDESSSGDESSTGTTGEPEPFCGDGIVNGDDEECDDGDSNAETAACKPDCTAAFCGDSLVQRGVEDCDDGNDVNTDGCTDQCVALPACGDGVINKEDGEQCDDGVDNGDTSDCLSDCQLASCGDGHVWTGHEICDDGNAENNDPCTTLCAPPTCGDGFVQTVNTELCDDGDLNDGDECNSDCFSAGLWTVTYNQASNNNDVAWDAAIDSVNNVIVAGEVFDAVQNDNIWVRSYNGNAAENWTDEYHNITSDTGYGVVVAPDDTIYVAGSSFSASNGRDMWLRQYDQDGTPGFLVTFDGSAHTSDEALGIALDPLGFIYIAGYATQTGSSRDIIVHKYDSTGSGPIWTRTASSAMASNDEGHDVAADADGNVVVVGYIWAGGNSRDIWIRKYDPDGNELWTDTHNGPASGNDEANGVETDSNGNIVVTGFEFTGAVASGGTERDVWTRKYDPDGVEIWTRTHNAPQNGNDVGEDIGIDTQDNVVVGGSIFRGTQQDNAWLRKYDPDGNELWTMEYNSDGFASDAIQGVAVDSEDNIAAVGFETRPDLGTGEARNIWIRYILQ